MLRPFVTLHRVRSWVRALRPWIKLSDFHIKTSIALGSAIVLFYAHLEQSHQRVLDVSYGSARGVEYLLSKRFFGEPWSLYGLHASR
jgi:hypothetical protein